MAERPALRLYVQHSAFGNQHFQYHLKAWHEVKLPEPSTSRTIDWMDIVDFGDGESEQVDAHHRSDTGHRLLVAAGKARARRPAPREAGISEHSDLHRNRSIEAVAAERAP